MSPLKQAVQGRSDTHLLHPVKLCVGLAGAADGSHSDMKKDTRVTARASVNACTKTTASDLDTSDDLSAELDRSHGFFTASAGGAGIRPIPVPDSHSERSVPVEFC